MSNNGALVTLNAAAEEYELQELLSSTYTLTGAAFGVGDAATIYWTWGNEYWDGGVGSFAGHGLLLQLSQIKTDPAATPLCIGTLVIPHLDVRHSVPFTSWIDLLTLLKPHDVILTVPVCDAWTMQWSGLEWLLNGSRYENLGSMTLSGSGYDPRLNCMRVAVGGGPTVLSEPTWPECNTPVQETSISGSLFGGWRHKPGGVWTNEPIDFLALSPPAVTGCSCTGNAKSADGSDCWNVTLPFYGISTVTDVRQADADCVCASNGVHAAIEDHLRTLRVEGYQNSATIAREDAGIVHTHTARASRCYNNTNTPPIPAFNVIEATIDEPHTVAPYRTDYSKMVGSQHCYVLPFPPPICPLGLGELGGFVCADPDQQWCEYDYYLQVDWPDNPCGDCDSEPWNFQEDIGHYHETCSKSGVITYKFSYFDRPQGAWAVNSVIRAGSKPRSCVGPDRRIALVYEHTANAYRAFSYDNGQTFTTGVMAIADGYKPTHCYGFDGTYYEFALVYNSGTSGPGKIKGQYLRPGATAFSTLAILKDDVGADLVFADDSFNVEAGRSTAAPLVLHGKLDGATATSRRASYDHGLTWKVITP